MATTLRKLWNIPFGAARAILNQNKKYFKKQTFEHTVEVGTQDLSSHLRCSPHKIPPSPVVGLTNTFLQQQQSRDFKTWQMRKDNRKRQAVKEYGPLRLRLNGLRKNEILPKELQEIADKEIADLPRDSCRTRIVNRCVLTGRARGNLRKYRICRMQWRLLADYSKLSGVTRSCW